MSTSDALQPRHRERPFGGARDRRADEIVGVGRRLEPDVFAETLDPHRAMTAAARDVGVRDQHARAALHPHHGLEHVDRVGDHRAVQHVVDGDRLAVEHRAGMRARVRRAAAPRCAPRPLRRSRIRPRSAARSARTARSARRCRTGSRTRPAASRSCCSTPRYQLRCPSGLRLRPRDLGRARARRRAPRRTCPSSTAAAARHTMPAAVAPPRSTRSPKSSGKPEVLRQRGRCEHVRLGDAVASKARSPQRDPRRRPRSPSSPAARTGPA